jgi:hypothetical protein
MENEGEKDQQKKKEERPKNDEQGTFVIYEENKGNITK